MTRDYVLHFLDGFVPAGYTLGDATIADVGLVSVSLIKIARNVVDRRGMGRLASQERNIPIVSIVGVLVITKVIPMAIRRQGRGARWDWQVVLVW